MTKNIFKPATVKECKRRQNRALPLKMADGEFGKYSSIIISFPPNLESTADISHINVHDIFKAHIIVNINNITNEVASVKNRYARDKKFLYNLFKHYTNQIKKELHEEKQ